MRDYLSDFEPNVTGGPNKTPPPSLFLSLFASKI